MLSHYPAHQFIRMLAASRAAAVTLALALCGSAAIAESSMAPGGGKASAQLNLRIIVPPVMQLEANQHPLQMVADDLDRGMHRAEQRLVVFSNLRRGLCMQLRLALPQVSGWQVQVADPASASLTPLGGDSYRLCTQRIGRTAIALVHRFEARGQTQPLPWPVQTDLHAI